MAQCSIGSGSLVIVFAPGSSELRSISTEGDVLFCGLLVCLPFFASLLHVSFPRYLANSWSYSEGILFEPAKGEEEAHFGRKKKRLLTHLLPPTSCLSKDTHPPMLSFVSDGQYRG